MAPTAVQPPPTSSSSEASTASDRGLAAHAARGDHQAFERLFQRHRAGVHAYALRMLADHAAAEDVVQDVFVSAMRAMRDGQQPVHVRAWLHEIARCACVDHWRGSERRREVSYDAPDTLSGTDARRMAVSGDVAMRGAVDRESLALLQSAFEDLPPLQHSVLVQRELEGRSPREIADRLGISPTAVEGQLARGRRSLAISYRELESGERCLATRGLCDDSRVRSLGVRERARLRIHLGTCGTCRRYARSAGVESRLIDPSALRQLGLLLPLSLLRRLPFGSLFGSGEALGGAVAGKALVGAAVLAAGGGGALMLSEYERPTTTPPAVAQAVPDAGASAATAPRGPLVMASAATGSRAAVTVAGVLVPLASVPAGRVVGSVEDRPESAATHGALEADDRRAGPSITGQAPLVLPRFVPVVPPRVTRILPVAGVAPTTVDEVGGDGSPSAPDAGGVRLLRGGKQPAAEPPSKIAGDGVAPVPEPAPEATPPATTPAPEGTTPAADAPSADAPDETPPTGMAPAGEPPADAPPADAPPTDGGSAEAPLADAPPADAGPADAPPADPAPSTTDQS